MAGSINPSALFQLILSPIRDWNSSVYHSPLYSTMFQLILSPIRDWNSLGEMEASGQKVSGSN